MKIEMTNNKLQIKNNKGEGSSGLNASSGLNGWVIAIGNRQ
jgi:hypothetical protein